MIGDPLTLPAGIMREPLRAVVPLLVVAKTVRYAVIAWATLAIA